MAAGSVSAWDIFVGGTGAVVASAAVLKTAWTIAQHSVGRRYILARKLTSLRLGMAQRYVERTFDVPLFESVNKPSWQGTADTLAVWDLRSAYLACDFKRGELAAFTVVTIDRWFQPLLQGFTRHTIKGRLGRATFEAATQHGPTAIRVRNGASSCDFSERHYYGRPGAYSDYILCSTSEGHPSPGVFPLNVEWTGKLEKLGGSVAACRQSSTINCITIEQSLGADEPAHDTLLGEIAKARLQQAR